MGYDENGYDELGYDRDGYDHKGRDQAGNLKDGVDEEDYPLPEDLLDYFENGGVL